MKKITSLLLVCLFFWLLAAPVQAGGDDPPYEKVQFNGNEYQIIQSQSTWEETVAYCESLGGHLATISSQEENDFLHGYVTSNGVYSVYFGAFLNRDTGTWEWVTGEPFDYRNWSPGEPNDQGSDEAYAMFYVQFWNGTWNDGTFDNGRLPVICEWEGPGVPEPPAEVTWKQVHGQWRCYIDGALQKNIWVQDSKGWLYMNEYGIPASNDWAKDSGGWYYMNASGYISRNAWAQDSRGWYYMGNDGRMVTGIVTIDGVAYRFASDGLYLGKA